MAAAFEKNRHYFECNTVAQNHSKSLKLAVYFVQRLTAASAPNFKMAAFRFLSVEEVWERDSRNQDEEMVIKNEDEVTLSDFFFFFFFFLSMPECLFRSLCTTLVGEEFAGLPDSSNILNTQIHASAVKRSECRLWLEAICRRLAGRRR